MTKSQWQRTLDAIAEAQRQMVMLGRSGEDLQALVAEAVSSGNLAVYWLLPAMDGWRPGLTLSVADELLDRALADRTAVQIRRTLGSLHRADLERIVAPLVLARLGDPDRPYADLDYRRYAELLEHLGLDTALRELVNRATGSTKPEVRAVAVDFGARLDGLPARPLATRLARTGPGR